MEKRIIFEDDSDREFFIALLEKLIARCPVKIVSWVLMDNHYHLLCKADLSDLEHFMRSLNTSYSQYFNGIHGHIGHVFQGRYSSFPIDDDSYLIYVIRYIHLNPLEAGAADIEQYAWSSYCQYLGGSGFCDLDDVREILGSVDEIRKLHDSPCSDGLIDLGGHRQRLSDAEAFELARKRFGDDLGNRITIMSREDRDDMICRLYRLGLSEPQIVRFAGLGRGIVHHARKNAHRRAD